MTTTAAIRAQVDACLAECLASKNPLFTLAILMGRLREQGWDAADLRQVERAVVKVLAGLTVVEEAALQKFV